MNQNDCSGKTLKPWPVFVDHYIATWEEVDLEKGIWEIPAARMKMRRPHLVPLSTQIINIFKQLKPITGHYPYIFIGRNNRSKPISKESVSQVIELLGYKGRATGHGFRHTMSTILHEQGFESVWIEMQLAHIDKNPIRGTYNHANYLEKRRDMLQWYANKLYSKEILED
jgi:integrase